MNRGYAKSKSVQAMTLMASNLLAGKLKKARSKVPKINESTLFAGKKFNKKYLESEIHSLALRETLLLQAEFPRTESAFKERIESASVIVDYQTWLTKIAEQVHALHRQYHQLQKVLSGKQLLTTITVVSDIKQQLERLFNKNYLSLISWAELEQYTRYMKGIEMRIEKYQRELPRQKMLSAQVNELEQRVYEKLQACDERSEYAPELVKYRWLIEEYRISLFAQQLGTRESVSQKRMQQRWQEIKQT